MGTGPGQPHQPCRKEAPCAKGAPVGTNLPKKGNPRRTNGSRRTKLRRRVLAYYDRCQICDGLVDKALPPGDEMAPEVDEIIPVSRGGSPYSWRNVGLAHRICNQRRGNKSLDIARREAKQAIGDVAKQPRTTTEW